MTAVVGIESDGKVWFGSDSASSGVSNSTICSVTNKKLFKRNGWLVGFAGNWKFETAFLNFKPLEPLGSDDDGNIFMDSFHRYIKSNKYNLNDWQIIVGSKGRIWTSYNDYHLERSVNCYNAIGIADEICLGSLASTVGFDPKTRIKTALKAASIHSNAVRPPFKIMSV